MLKLVKFLKPFAGLVFAIVLLLFGQALCDLSLPAYMSNIVNIGIQQGGIDSAVPKIIRQSKLEEIQSLVGEEEQKTITQSFTLLDKNLLSPDQYERYVREYPALEREPLYELNSLKQERVRDLNQIFGKAILLSEIPPGTEQTAAKAYVAQMPDSMINQAATLFIRQEYERIGVNTDRLQANFILMTGLKMLLVTLLSVLATIVVGYLAAKVAAGLAKELRRSVFRKAVGFSNAEFDRFSTASLITRSTNDIQQIQMLLVMLLRIVFYAPILGIGGVLKVLNSDYSMGWIIGVALAAILAVVISFFWAVMPKFKVIQKLVDRLNLVTREILTGTLVIRAFNNQKYEEKKFAAANQDLTRTNLFVNRVMALMFPIMMLIMNGVTVLIVWVGAHQIDRGVMQVGNMMAFIQYAMMIIMAFLMISMVSIMLPRAAVSAERIGEVLDAAISIRDEREPLKLGEQAKGCIEFQDVSFRYPGAEENVLSGISFLAKPGQTTAFIGSTGSGKTTILNLIPRFYDVTAGRILIDGIDIRRLAQHELRELIGYAPQKAVLFSGSIASNLSYGVENADQNELLHAAEVAQAAQFIREKAEGLQAEIAQGGANVSGGQKQRLSIARALVKKPKIYLFDDSFSALDFKTDAALRKALKEVTADSTVLIVAQRISTIMHADQIIVLDEGKIAGKGTHQELLQNCEVYRQIAYSQFSKEELA